MAQKPAGSVSLAGENQSEVNIQIHESWSKIEKVPAILREIKANSGCFDPLVVSIGPYHHGKPELELMQRHKETMARQYANKDPKTSLEDLYQKFSPLAIDARECYTYKERNKFNDKEFIEMMVLDTCFIVEFIDCIANNKSEALKMKSNMIAFVQRDLLLLENQIPFEVLNEILGVKFGNEKMEMLRKFVSKIRNLPPEESNKTITNFFSSFAFWGKKSKQQDGNGKAKAKPLDGEPAHLLDYMRSNLIDKYALTNNSKGKGNGNGNSSYWFSYRSAKELKAVGIRFKPSKNDKFTDVYFQPMCYFRGYLNLPKICIDDSTKSILLNMVAHESSINGPDDLGVSSYICFMDSLVDHAEDVMELRKKGILLNFLGSDQKVADLFNDISDNLVANPSAYAGVKKEIDKHYKNWIKIWVAEGLHNHFSSPWTVLAFIGAVSALVLSVIQTYESIKPSNC